MQHPDLNRQHLVKTEDYLERCLSFLIKIGIRIVEETLEESCFLPGLSIRNGVLILDREKLLYPGDILHEAGHIAVVPAVERNTLTAATIAARPMRQAEEMMTIAWSYAACIHLGLDPYVVFHDDGYQGGGSYIADNFNNKKYFGLPMLQWKGMAADEKKAAELQVPCYPNMLKWMHD